MIKMDVSDTKCLRKEGNVVYMNIQTTIIH